MAEGVFTLQQGRIPLLLSLPHVGVEIPAHLQAALQPRALQVEDTDWHLSQLYQFAHALGASVLTPRFSRYVIDLNRPPDNALMYPGSANTELCPTRFFTGEALYRDDQQPATAEVAARRAQYWLPYHTALQAELLRLRGLYGYALLWDAHSIRSQLPWLFAGKLPDFNLGTVQGASCAPALQHALTEVLQSFGPSCSFAVNGRFQGGYITRHYGQPAQQIHAIQLEMCQSLYMQEAPPYSLLPALAGKLVPRLQQLLECLLLTAQTELA